MFHTGLMANRHLRTLGLLSVLIIIILVTWSPALRAQTAQHSDSINTIDGGAGACSIELTVLDPGGKPVYAALVNVRIAYGFRGVRKLDLSVYTDNSGKAIFTGLPDKVHKPPVIFRASKENQTGEATYNPATECKAKHDIVLHKR